MELKINDVSYSYKKINYKEKSIFSHITTIIDENKISTFIGKNGSGKSTFLNLINQTLLPSDGVIEVGGFQIKANSKVNYLNNYRFEVGLIYQFPEEQFLQENVRDELLLGMRLYNYRLNDFEKRLVEALKMVGLPKNYLDYSLSNLSSGEKRKIAIASVLIYNPKIILLDEPTVGLDYQGKRSIIKLLKILKNRYKKTIIVTSNDMDMLLNLVDNVYVIHNKSIVLSGNKYDVFSSEKIRDYGISVPKIIEFSIKVKNKKNVRLGYRDEINDLLKDIYRKAR